MEQDIEEQGTSNIDNAAKEEEDEIQIVIEELIDDDDGKHRDRNDRSEHKMEKKKSINRLSERLNPRKVKREKTRSFVALEPTDNYLALSWIQRFRIFDKSCDSIEKL